MKNVVLIVNLLLFLLPAGSSTAQVYNPITHVVGQTIVNGHVVSVYPGGTNAVHEYTCGVGPYRVGYDDFGDSGYFKFVFDPPVANVRVQATAINEYETVSFMLNKKPYLLTAADFSLYQDQCPLTVDALLENGMMVGPPGAYADSAARAQAHITQYIQELEVHIHNMGYGVHFNLSFEGKAVGGCVGDSVILPADDHPGATYAWSGPGGFTDTARNPVLHDLDTSHTGLYTVRITTSSGTITNTVYVSVTELPVNDILIPDAVCLGSDLVLTDTSTRDDVTYLWEMPTQSTSTRMPLEIDSLQLYHDGVYKLTTYAGGCIYETSKEVEVLRPSSYRFTRASCQNEPFVLNGVPLMESGTYQDTVTASNGCDSFIQVKYIAFPIPEPSLQVLNAGRLCMNDTIQIQAAGGLRYEWYDGGNNLLGTGDHLNYTYTDNREPVIRVVAINEYECRVADSVRLSLVPCCSVYLPNAFTPNGDGKNDQFSAIVYGHPEEYMIRIYNRYGEMVFTSSDPKIRWDGTYKGRDADVGVYFFEFSTRCMDGAETYKKGDVTLIR